MSQRERRRCRIFAFHSQTAAEGFFCWARERGLEGRLIPTPSSIEAGCGLAYALPAESPDVEPLMAQFRRLAGAGPWGDSALYY